MKKLLFAVVALVMGMMTANANALPEPGVYKIKNVYSGTYVVLQHNYLADITADQDGASLLYTWYRNKPNGEGLLTDLSGDGGDMIETLDFIKRQIKIVLEHKDQPTWFLDEMFQLHLVSTGDADGSVYLCVDVPAIDDWDTIKAAILEAAGGQQAVTYYITHMVPGNRHYMGIDYDGSFGYRLEAGTEEGTDIKWLMEPQDVDYDGYAYVRAAADAATPYLALNERYNAALSMDAATRTFNPGAVYRMTRANVQTTQLRTQGIDFAPVAGNCRLTMNQTFTSADKFTYNARYLRLDIPAEGWNSADFLAGVAQVLGNESGIYQALLAAQDKLVANTAIYFVPRANGVAIMDEDERIAAGDDAKWIVEEIDNDQVYFAANPTVEHGGKFYATLYTDFPYQIVGDGVKAMIVNELDEAGEAGYEQLVELGSNVVPATTAVVLECTSQIETENMLMPIVENATSGAPRRAGETSDNVLQGTFFNNDVAVTDATRVLTADGFTAPSASYVEGNTAWLDATGIHTAIDDVKSATTTDGVFYDLTGRRVSNPAPGIYIMNHRKVLVK
ncbi:MAG: hypothetical protein IJ775_00250 [Muribaculaceae bacterium]|nr:hypothetical protein [Muribaculaceae bacterium]